LRKLSPGLFVVHSRQANNAPFVSALPAVQGVKTVFTGAGGPIPSGDALAHNRDLRQIHRSCS